MMADKNLRHAHRPMYIPYASFSNITIPNECHRADILNMPYDKVGRVTYLFCLNIVDVASRYKASIPIGSTSVKNREGKLLNGPERRFIREELLLVNDGVDLPPESILHQ
ncbi:15934_t:CDS:2 [Rhizophagus irregularis]|nr:15934_t:CDS:2 [Rhizophagus irregularis]